MKKALRGDANAARLL